MALKAGYVGIKGRLMKQLSDKLMKLDAIIPAGSSADNPLATESEITDIWADNAITGVHQLFYDVKEGYTIVGDEETGYGISSSTNAVTFIGKIKKNVTYKIQKAAVGNRFRVVIFPNEPSGVKQADALQLINDNNATSYTFITTSDFNYVAFTANVTNAVDTSAIKALCKIAADKSELITDYAETNIALTASAADQKTAINAIITAATEAADFAAFKTAMGAITPVTRSLSAPVDTREIVEPEPEPEVKTTKRSTKKTATE